MRLKHYCADAGQYGVNVSPDEYGVEGLRMVRTSDLTNSGLRPAYEGVFIQVPVPAVQVLEPGDILLSRAGTIGRSYLVPDEAAGHTFAGFLVRFRPGSGADPRFVTYAIQSTPVQQQITADAVTSTISNFNADKYANLELPTAPLEEQRRIADFLDDRVARIDQIIAARQQQTKLIDGARVALVDSVLSPSPGAGLTRLGRLATIQSGLTIDEKRSNASDGDPYPYLRVANVQAGGLNLAEVKEVVVDPALASRCTLRSGDVLMTEGGDLDKLGRGTVWHGEISPCLHQNHVFAVRPDPALLLPEYLALYTQASAARSYFEQTGSKTTNLASTSASKVMALPFPAVPTVAQRELVAECQRHLSAVDKGVEALTSAVALLQEYKQSLITAAVTGEFDVTTAAPIPE